MKEHADVLRENGADMTNTTTALPVNLAADIEDYQRHPFGSKWPDMSGAEIDALATDIKENGQRFPALLFDGMILDGWHRYLACIRAGVPLKVETYRGKNPAAFVISVNKNRRHSSPSQNALAAAACIEWRVRGGDYLTAPGAVSSGETVAEVAESVGVSPRTMAQAKLVEANGSHELKEAVRGGEISLKKAEPVARMPEEEQAAALENATSEKAKAPKPPKDEIIAGRITELEAALEQKIEEYDDLAYTAREMEIRLTAFEAKEPDEQQKEIITLQKTIDKLEFEIKRLTRQRNDCQETNNQLKREVGSLRRRLERG